MSPHYVVNRLTAPIARGTISKVRVVVLMRQDATHFARATRAYTMLVLIVQLFHRPQQPYACSGMRANIRECGCDKLSPSVLARTN